MVCWQLLNQFCGVIWPRLTINTAGQLCKQPCNVNTHSQAHLPSCVLKMVAWLGFACIGLYTDRHAKASLTIAHLVWSRRTVHAFLEECNFEQNFNFAVHPYFNKAVNGRSMSLYWPRFMPRYGVTLQRWVLIIGAIKSCGRDTKSVLCWSYCAEPGLKQGHAHCQAYILVAVSCMHAV